VGDIVKEIIRVKSIHIENIKNVSNGSIRFPDYSDQNEITSNIIGLYGQNGSGKTAVVNALRIIQSLFSGQTFASFLPLMQTGKLYYSIDFEFNIYTEEKIINVNYFFKYNKLGGFEEKITYKSDNEKSVVSINDETFYANKVFSPNVRHEDFGVTTSQLMMEYLTQRKYNREKVKSSFFFDKEFSKTIIKNLKDQYFKLIITLMPTYAKKNFFVVENARNANLIASILMPIGLSFMDTKGEESYVDNHFSSGLNQCNENLMKAIKQGIDNINTIITTLIPNFKIDINIFKEIASPFGDKVFQFELYATRDKMSFPLALESDGVKKLISITSCLIHMYNHENVFLVIDELDSGIYEYLIGELLQVLEEGGKGQLLFTSHNLRPLEILQPSDIWFATSNPENRYIQFTGIKPNHNLRSMYYRTIRLGGQAEELYSETDQYKIRMAFAKAAIKNE
jgi:energy-coupling factor transporter ATP-binding protein EcfA2